MSDIDQDFKTARELASEWSSGYREFEKSSDDGATSFAQLLVQSLLLLHGGALIALPGIFKDSPGSLIGHISSVWWMFAIFVTGLICAVIVAALGFHALALRASQNQKMAVLANARAMHHGFSIKLAKEPGSSHWQEALDRANKEIPQITEEAEKLGKKFMGLRTIAVILSWVSIFCLILGAGLGLSIL